jgi:putative FmdB family regulatory protein
MPLRDIKCVKCGHEFEALIRNQNDLANEQCCKCESSKLELLMSYPANYTIAGNNSASVRPRRMGGGK